MMRSASMKNESKRRRQSRSMVASVTLLDGSGRTVLCGPTEPAPTPSEPEPKAPRNPRECAKLRRVECERCLRYGGGPGRRGASCPFGMGEEDEKP